MIVCCSIAHLYVGGTGMMSIKLPPLSKAHRAHVRELTHSTLCCTIDGAEPKCSKTR